MKEVSKKTMIYNNIFDYQYNVGMIDDAEMAIEDNDIETIKSILDFNRLLGTESPNSFDRSSLYQIALSQNRDEIAYLMYKSCPTQLRLHSIEHYFYQRFMVCTDILGACAIYNRVELMERLLLEDDGAFHVDGIRSSRNLKLSTSYIKEYDSPTCNFSLSWDFRAYISSPLLISIIMGHWDSYSFLKSKGAYFDPKDLNCRFHLEHSPSVKIIEDSNKFQ